MFKYVVRRLIQAIPIFFGITLLSYFLMAITPGGPVAALTFGSRMSMEDIERFRVELGVNDPLSVQYIRWLLGDDWMRWDSDGDGISDRAVLISLTGPNGEVLPPGNRYGIIRGDFGRSFSKRRPVLDVLIERLPGTIELGVASLIIGGTFGIIVGVLAAVNHRKWFDHITRVLAVVFDAVPGFFFALILLLVFAKTLGWFPLGDRCQTLITDSCPPIYERLEYMVLPVFSLAIGIVSGWSRYMRASMLDVVSQDYIRTAHAKGLNARQVWFRHGMRNALIPIATFLGPAITGLLGGAVITETIFNYPGVGRTVIEAVGARDYPIVMAVTVYAGVATILGYLLSDILYGLIDPRIRYN
ncbi:MAG: ABC transporter permease [Anaerolineae bacterium]|jgi:peptide/nickel transport system permease protein|nr:ABC transporter permease [Anaerolineae bacterium]